METPIVIDDARFDRFQALREAFKTEAKWRAPGPLRDATALAAVPLDGAPQAAARSVNDAATTLKANGRGPLLRGTLRHVLAALLLRRGLDAAAFARDISAARQTWRTAKLRRGGLYRDATLALLTIVRGAPPDRARLEALKSAYDDLNRVAFWSTGPQVLPALALAGHAPAPRTEEIFRALKTQKIRGQSIMAAAAVLTRSDAAPGALAEAMGALAHALREAQIRAPAGNPSALALAVLTRRPTAEIASKTAALRARLRAAPGRPRDAAALAFDFWTASALQNAPGEGDSAAAMLFALHAFLVLQAQSAAAIAAVTGATAATAH